MVPVEVQPAKGAETGMHGREQIVRMRMRCWEHVTPGYVHKLTWTSKGH